MDRTLLFSLDRTCFVDRFADHVDDAAEGLVADRNFNWLSGICDSLSADQTFRSVHGNGAHGGFAEMLRDFQHEALSAVRRFERVQNSGQVILELHVNDGTDDLRDFSDCVGCCHIFLVTDLERLSTGDDLDQFLRDHRLACAIVSESLLADHLAGIAGSVIHRAHARALFGRRVFQQRAKDLHR